jgi:cytochrome c oxidase subunit 3
MDVTELSEEEKIERSKKMLLWFGIVSLIMGFAGWTSAYIVSSSREDWMQGLELPQIFYVSTGVIVLSSITYILAKKAIKQDKPKQVTNWLFATLLLGIVFIIMQFLGFQSIVDSGYNFTGPTSNIKMSFVFLIAAVHILHVVAGLISLAVVIYQHLNKKYTSTNYLGITLGATFWHFLDLLWVYLILFMLIVK